MKHWPAYILATKERPKSYNAYLKTRWWQRRRKSFVSKFAKTCGMCLQPCTKPNLHHISYANIGAEMDEDLCWMCEECHKRLHKEHLKVALTRFPLCRPAKPAPATPRSSKRSRRQPRRVNENSNAAALLVALGHAADEVKRIERLLKAQAGQTHRGVPCRRR